MSEQTHSKRDTHTYKIGSSETTREMLSTQFFFRDYIRFGTVRHKPNPKPVFLEWFIGFFEAEGCFLKWPSNNMQDRFAIEVSQKDAQLIYKIRSQLGFGKIVETGKNNQTYWRFYVGNLENVRRMILLLNGNLVTRGKQEKLRAWLDSFNQRYGTNILFLERSPEISSQNAWLSGFFEGDAGFYVSSNKIVRVNKNNSSVFDIKMKFYVTQKEEEELLYRIKHLFKIPSPIYQITNGHSLFKYNRIETNRLDCHLLIAEYLTRYPFLGKRFITFSRWKRIIDYRIKKYPMTKKSVLKLKRLILETKREF